jgi:hypothetical protein
MVKTTPFVFFICLSDAAMLLVMGFRSNVSFFHVPEFWLSKQEFECEDPVKRATPGSDLSVFIIIVT